MYMLFYLLFIVLFLEKRLVRQRFVWRRMLKTLLLRDQVPVFCRNRGRNQPKCNQGKTLLCNHDSATWPFITKSATWPFITLINLATWPRQMNFSMYVRINTCLMYYF